MIAHCVCLHCLHTVVDPHLRDCQTVEVCMCCSLACAGSEQLWSCRLLWHRDCALGQQTRYLSMLCCMSVLESHCLYTYWCCGPTSDVHALVGYVVGSQP
jgi:hypothetical protein